MISLQDLQFMVLEQARNLVQEYKKPVKMKVIHMKKTLSNHVMLDSICYILMVGALMMPMTLWMILPTYTFVYWSVVVGTFVVLPLLDLCFPRDKDNLSEKQVRERKEHRIYQWLPMVYPIVQTGVMYWALDHYVRYVQHLTWGAKLGFFGSIGIVTSALGTNIAHELFHKKAVHEQVSGIYLLFMLCYSHFYIEHIWGHHKHVGTPDDTASAERYETIYYFIPKSFIGGIQSAYGIEEKRRKKKRLAWHHNRVLQYQAIQGLVLWILYQWFGMPGLVAFLGQSVVSIALVECTNYIEHYGLSRKCLSTSSSSPVYEPVTVLHSWNATEVLTNYLLLKLQRHSDHHAYPFKRYQTLSSYNLSPQLPTGYPGMILLAFCPPLFFYIVHPLLDQQLERTAKVHSVSINNRTNTLTVNHHPSSMKR